jgi:uncharacterized HAD superfamily protein
MNRKGDLVQNKANDGWKEHQLVSCSARKTNFTRTTTNIALHIKSEAQHRLSM